MWEELYEAHHSELLRWCAAACQNQALAEDLAQETFLRAMQEPDTFEDLGPNQRRAWLYRTMKNMLVDRIRRAKLEARYIETYPEDTEQLEPGYGAAKNAMLLSALTDQDRTLFHLRYVEGYTAAELARMFRMPPGTVRARLSRTRMLLKKLLSD